MGALAVGAVAIGVLAIGGISDGENAKFISAGLTLFAGAGVAFSRSVKRIQNPRWWHWILGGSSCCACSSFCP